MTTRDQEWLKKVRIKAGVITLRELEESDNERITEIVRAYSYWSTLTLFKQYNEKRLTKESIEKKDNDLMLLFGSFEHIKHKSQLSVEEMYRNPEKLFTEKLLYSPYGPLGKQPFEKTVKEYVTESVAAQSETPRRLFRLGIEYNGILIGCFVFDTIPDEIDEKKCTGDIGIFIRPEYRRITANNQLIRTNKEAFYTGVSFIKRIFPYYSEFKLAELYISASTHPFNSETRGIFDMGFTKVKSLAKNKTGYESPRDFYLMKYNNFCDKFLKRMQGDYTIQAGDVEITSAVSER